jgi:hypothetical protein
MAVKDISEMYPITNRFWQYIDNMSLYEYLVSLGADPRSQGFIKGYPGRFYLRVGIYGNLMRFPRIMCWLTLLNILNMRIMDLRLRVWAVMLRMSVTVMLW